MDVSISLMGIILFAPMMIAIVFSILLTSCRPILFSQVRVGKDGKRFVLKKFRTMTVECGTLSGALKPGSKRRTTTVGRLFRNSKLDELPQLWNVLIGDMLVVGPRPEVPSWVDIYPERWKNALSVKPGITDPASLAYSDEESILSRSSDPEKTYKETILPTKLGLDEL